MQSLLRRFTLHASPTLFPSLASLSQKRLRSLTRSLHTRRRRARLVALFSRSRSKHLSPSQDDDTPSPRLQSRTETNLHSLWKFGITPLLPPDQDCVRPRPISLPCRHRGFGTPTCGAAIVRFGLPTTVKRDGCAGDLLDGVRRLRRLVTDLSYSVQIGKHLTTIFSQGETGYRSLRRPVNVISIFENDPTAFRRK